MATLYIVGTPIGNLEDITLRAIRVLKEADLVLCEDTRMTQRLLKHYGIINKQLTTYNEQKSGKPIEKIAELIKEGKNLALVSDAGTPGISDPGSHLVIKLREQFGESLNIVAVPGPSAVVSALSVSGLPASDFLFLGFLPHKKGRETLFKEIVESKRTVVFYESTHRILKTLEKLAKIIESPRKVVVARELTKIHEEVFSGTAPEALAYFLKTPVKQKGEFVVIVERR